MSPLEELPQPSQQLQSILPTIPFNLNLRLSRPKVLEVDATECTLV